MLVLSRRDHYQVAEFIFTCPFILVFSMIAAEELLEEYVAAAILVLLVLGLQEQALSLGCFVD